jgi:hypothetical protein
MKKGQPIKKMGKDHFVKNHLVKNHKVDQRISG